MQSFVVKDTIQTYKALIERLSLSERLIALRLKQERNLMSTGRPLSKDIDLK